MHIYEVNLEVDLSIQKRYLHWLKSEHIPEVLSHEGFEKAELLLDINAQMMKIRVLYSIASAVLLEKYLELQAPALRAKSSEKWGDKFKATRTIWPESVTIMKKS